MRKSFSFWFGLLTIFVFITGCKKESGSNSDSIQGLWELRKVYGGWVNRDYQPGNGYTISFSGNRFELKENGQLTQSGEFSIVSDPTVSESTCLNIAAAQYTNRIIFNNNTNGTKTFFELSGDKLTLLAGCFAFDAGSFRDYVRQ